MKHRSSGEDHRLFRFSATCRPKDSKRKFYRFEFFSDKKKKKGRQNFSPSVTVRKEGLFRGDFHSSPSLLFLLHPLFFLLSSFPKKIHKTLLCCLSPASFSLLPPFSYLPFSKTPRKKPPKKTGKKNKKTKVIIPSPSSIRISLFRVGALL